MTGTAVRTPAVGDPVFFEGLPHRISAFAGARVEFVSELQHDAGERNAEGQFQARYVPRFRTVGIASELRWSDELRAWYLWGRVLCKGRGGVGMDARLIVAELRDRGLLPARPTRKPGQGPAGGEQMNLYCCLFSPTVDGTGVNWAQELANVKRGEGLSLHAQTRVAEYRERFRHKLARGYADPDANDSSEEVARG